MIQLSTVSRKEAAQRIAAGSNNPEIDTYLCGAHSARQARPDGVENNSMFGGHKFLTERVFFFGMKIKLCSTNKVLRRIREERIL